MEKSLEEKTVLERHTLDGKFNLGLALVDMDNKIKTLTEMVKNQHEALEFLAKWYEENAQNAIQIPKQTITLI